MYKQNKINKRNEVKPDFFTVAYLQNAHIWCLKVFKLNFIKNELFVFIIFNSLSHSSSICDTNKLFAAI